MATYDTPIPGAFGSAGYAQANLNANTAYKNALARINQQRSGLLRQYGYLGSVDPTTGVIGKMTVDPHNAYGGLQSMLRNQALDAENAQYAAEARGLHGGLAHKADSQLAYDRGKESFDFGNALTSGIGALQDQQTTAAQERDRALYEAEQAAEQAAYEAQMFNQGDYGGLDYPQYGVDPSAALLAQKVLSNRTSVAQQLAKAVAVASNMSIPLNKLVPYKPPLANAYLTSATKRG